MKGKINRRQFCRLAGAGILSAGLAPRSFAQQVTTDSAKKPNVIFILSDKLLF